MKKILWMTMLLMMLWKAAGAQEFSSEMTLAYTSTETAHLDLNEYSVIFFHYFEVLEAETGPLARAELIERPNLIEIDFDLADGDNDAPSASLDGQMFSVYGRYIQGDYGVFAGYLDGTIDTDFTGTLTSNVDNVYYTLGGIVYLQPTVRLNIGYIWGELDYSYSRLLSGYKSDIDSFFVVLETLFGLDDGRYLSLDVALSRLSEEDRGNTTDSDTIDLELGYFFNRYTGVYLDYEQDNGEGSEKFENYGLRIEYFLNQASAIGAGVHHSVDNASDDTNEFQLYFKNRF